MSATPAPEAQDLADDGYDLLDLALPLAQHWRFLVLAPIIVALAAVGLSFVIPKSYTSETVLLPPQQQQSSAASALAQVGALAALGGLAGLTGGMKSPADQYVALLESTSVADRLIDAFDLMEVYGEEYRFESRKRLAKNTSVTLGKKDGLITIKVSDRAPQRAADIANRYVQELRRLTSQLALSEAQQRRVFFEVQLAQTRDRLTQAQRGLQASGFTQGALRADARASAEGYARLRAEATATEVRLQTLRRHLADSTPEVQQALSALYALRAQLAKLETSIEMDGTSADYIGKFREFKYQETLFDLFARQYELARVDESREGALIQVVDEAQPAERASRPPLIVIAMAAAFIGWVVAAGFVLARQAWHNAALRPATVDKVAALRSAWRSAR